MGSTVFQATHGPVVELFAHRTQSEWTGGLPAGTKLEFLWVYVGTGGTADFCDSLANVPIERL
jgi:hypothetical protein